MSLETVRVDVTWARRDQGWQFSRGVRAVCYSRRATHAARRLRMTPGCGGPTGEPSYVTPVAGLRTLFEKAKLLARYPEAARCCAQLGVKELDHLHLERVREPREILSGSKRQFWHARPIRPNALG
jgi:hypothetical protein